MKIYLVRCEWSHSWHTEKGTVRIYAPDPDSAIDPETLHRAVLRKYKIGPGRGFRVLGVRTL